MNPGQRNRSVFFSPFHFLKGSVVEGTRSDFSDEIGGIKSVTNVQV